MARVLEEVPARGWGAVRRDVWLTGVQYATSPDLLLHQPGLPHTGQIADARQEKQKEKLPVKWLEEAGLEKAVFSEA